jgi:hypothetical protein
MGNLCCRSGPWSEDDFEVFDGDRCTGRVYRVDSQPEVWFRGVTFHLTGKATYGHVPTFDEAKAAFKATYLEWQARRFLQGDQP